MGMCVHGARGLLINKKPMILYVQGKSYNFNCYLVLVCNSLMP